MDCHNARHSCRDGLFATGVCGIVKNAGLVGDGSSARPGASVSPSSHPVAEILGCKEVGVEVGQSMLPSVAVSSPTNVIQLGGPSEVEDCSAGYEVDCAIPLVMDISQLSAADSAWILR